MKNIIFLPVSLLLIMVISSCEKVIDVDLKSTAKKYVIEGIVTDQAGGSMVKITQTKDFNENNNFPGVSGAAVIIKDNGVAIPLQETGSGIYTNAGLKGISGHRYILEVKIDGQTFTASSSLPSKVNFDTMYVKEEEFFGVNRKIPNVSYVDPPGSGNSYRFVLYKNGEQQKTIYVVNDDYADNRPASWQLLTYDEEEEEDKVKTNDIIRVDMFCIDKAMYKYWFSLLAASGGGSGSTPANPVTNISGGALGYFSAHTSQRREVVVE
ncbi:MAG: DUF4249 domain-containing protein [Bacteroidota bacterium]